MTLPHVSGPAIFVGKSWSHDHATPAVWVYRLTAPNWQQAVLTSDGMFSVISDYGNYAHGWVNWSSSDFRSFFCQLREDYLLRKISVPQNKYQPEKTRVDLRRAIFMAYKRGCLDREELREVLGLLYEADLDHAEGIEEFFQEQVGDRDMDDLLRCEAWDVICYGSEHDGDAVSYCKLLLPVLQRAVRDQIASEASGSDLQV